MASTTTRFYASLITAAVLSSCAGQVLAQYTENKSATSHSSTTTSTTTTTTIITPPQIVMPMIQRRTVLLPRPVATPVRLTQVHADVAIVDQIATTTLELTLHNPASTPQESVLVLPVPEGVSLRSVQYDGVGPEPTAKLLARDEARAIYNDIVRSMRDPALVEFVGLNLIQTSVFPVPAGGTQKLRVTMEQALIAQGGRVDYTLARSNSLTTGETSEGPTWSMAIDVRSRDPIATVYSPSHSATITTISPTHSKITLAGPGSGAGSVRLSYLTTPNISTQPVFTVFACPRPAAKGELPGGHFMILGSLPPRASTALPRKREVMLVIDRSGSMRGQKMEQARAAALSLLDGLNEGEAFNIFDYSDTIRSFSETPVIKSATTLAQAKDYVAGIKPEGGTNIHGALAAALQATPTSDMMPMVLFVTDGLPTIGERNEFKIRADAAIANASHRRIFSFGVGLDVNAPLLAALAQTSRGFSTTVLPDEDLEVSVSRVFRGLAGPVLEMPILTSTPGLLRDAQPSTLPDYFEGDQIMIVGEYVTSSTSKPVELMLNGTIGGQPVRFPISIDPAQASMRHDYIPRLWATRRIAALIDLIRQSDLGADLPGSDPSRHKEVVDEIVRLSTTYGVLTEYTAFLAKEETALGSRDMLSLRAAAEGELQRRAVQDRSGAGGVNQQLNIDALKDAGSTGASASVRRSRMSARESTPGATPPPDAVAMNKSEQRYYDKSLAVVTVTTIRQIGAQTFYQRAGRWIDARILTGDTTSTPEPDTTIVVGSDAYFELAEQLARSNEQQLLAQDGDVLLLVDSRRVLIRQTN
jgi:Ca-activated chloride channel family protein